MFSFGTYIYTSLITPSRGRCRFKIFQEINLIMGVHPLPCPLVAWWVFENGITLFPWISVWLKGGVLIGRRALNHGALFKNLTINLH